MQQRYKTIQGLRAFGSIYVCLFHIIYWWNKPNDILTGLFDKGNYGVDIFFVLSGFVLYVSIKELQPGFKSFLFFFKRRIIRIYPIYFILIGFFLLFGLIAANSHSVEDIAMALILAPGHKPLIIVSWTLQYEIYFYFLLSMYVLFPKFKWGLFLLLPLSLISVLNCLGLPSVKIPVSGMYNEFVLEFFCGIGCALLINKSSYHTSTALLLIGSILFIFAPFNTSVRFLDFGVPAACILFGLVGLEKLNIIIVPRWVTLLGDASYVLYLIHVPLISFALPKPGSQITIERIYILLIVTVIIILSIIVHLYIEKPILKKLISGLIATKQIKK